MKTQEDNLLPGFHSKLRVCEPTEAHRLCKPRASFKHVWVGLLTSVWCNTCLGWLYNFSIPITSCVKINELLSSGAT